MSLFTKAWNKTFGEHSYIFHKEVAIYVLDGVYHLYNYVY